MRRAFALSLLLLELTALAQTVPTGWAHEVLSTSFQGPIGLDQLPDGRFFVAEQWTGNIQLVVNGAVSTVANVSGLSTGYSRGLISIAVDPDWPLRPHLYLLHTHASPPSVRLSMMTASGALSDPLSPSLTLSGLYSVIDDIPDQDPIHNGGTLRFLPDGTLLVSFGEDNSPCDAQDVGILRGKILRLSVQALPQPGSGPPSKSTLVPSGNPFTGPNDNARLVYVLGLRNPFRFHVDPLNSNLLIADVGDSTQDEINHVAVPGANCGWPWIEGTASLSSCPGTLPIVVAPFATHAVGGAPRSLISLALYRNPAGGANNFGADYEGDYFYCDHFTGDVYRRHFDGTNWIVATAVPGQPDALRWGSGVQRVADAMVGRDGAIYLLHRPTPSSGSLARIRPSLRTLTITSGDNQAGNAGQALHAPFVVTLTSATGAPVPGAPVTFSTTSGAGTLTASTALTNSAGLATTLFTLSTTPATTLLVTATAAHASTINFQVVWRGLAAAIQPPGSTLSIIVSHSQTSSPLTIALDFPPPAPVATAYGPVWTSVLSPTPTALVLDGLGLLGPANPAILSSAQQPTYTLSIPNIPPLGGVTLILQAYALDTTRLPLPEAVFISNPIPLLFP